MEKNNFLSQDEKVLYTKKFSIFRLITNTNANVTFVLVFLLLCSQYFIPNLSKYLFPLLALQIACLVIIIVITIHNYKNSIFMLTNQRLLYAVSTSPSKNWINLKHEEIKSIKINNYDIVVSTIDNHNYKIEAISNPKEVVEKLNELIKK